MYGDCAKSSQKSPASGPKQSLFQGVAVSSTLNAYWFASDAEFHLRDTLPVPQARVPIGANPAGGFGNRQAGGVGVGVALNMVGVGVGILVGVVVALGTLVGVNVGLLNTGVAVGVPFAISVAR